MTPEQQATLRAELVQDPEDRGYAAHLPGDPQRVLDLLMAQNYTMVKSRFITARTVLAECDDGAAILDGLTAASANVSAVKWALTFLSQDSGLDVGHPRTQTMIGELSQGGKLTAEQASQLKVLAVQPASRADVLGIPAPTARDIVDAWSNE